MAEDMHAAPAALEPATDAAADEADAAAVDATTPPEPTEPRLESPAGQAALAAFWGGLAAWVPTPPDSAAVPAAPAVDPLTGTRPSGLATGADLAAGNWHVTWADALQLLRALPDDSVDLVFGSPPYDAKCRRYGSGRNLRGQDWVDWMVEVYVESLRVCRGLVAYVVDGSTSEFRWSATPVLLMADLHRRGVCLRKPVAYVRNGIPGSGGSDWWKNNWEFIVCATRASGALPWADNTACGHPPLYKRSGPFSNRRPNGQRNHRDYAAPPLANPGNVINCKVGGNQMGNNLSHRNEAPYPEELPRRFVASFCRPGGVVCDPFSGSGTTLAVAVALGRHGLGGDVRADQVTLTRERVGGTLATPDARRRAAGVVHAPQKRQRPAPSAEDGDGDGDAAPLAKKGGRAARRAAAAGRKGESRRPRHGEVPAGPSFAAGGADCAAADPLCDPVTIEFLEGGVLEEPDAVLVGD